MLRRRDATLYSGDLAQAVGISADTIRYRRADIKYTFEELPAGGCVRIATMNHDCVNAIHDFLAFQIQEHHTGDPAAE